MDDNGKFFLGLLAGLGIGTVLGILIAPDKGSETYRKIEGAVKDAAEDIIDYGTRTASSAKEAAQKKS